MGLNPNNIHVVFYGSPGEGFISYPSRYSKEFEIFDRSTSTYTKSCYCEVDRTKTIIYYTIKGLTGIGQETRKNSRGGRVFGIRLIIDGYAPIKDDSYKIWKAINQYVVSGLTEALGMFDKQTNPIPSHYSIFSFDELDHYIDENIEDFKFFLVNGLDSSFVPVNLVEPFSLDLAPKPIPPKETKDLGAMSIRKNPLDSGSEGNSNDSDQSDKPDQSDKNEQAVKTEIQQLSLSEKRIYWLIIAVLMILLIGSWSYFGFRSNEDTEKSESTDPVSNATSTEESMETDPEDSSVPKAIPPVEAYRDVEPVSSMTKEQLFSKVDRMTTKGQHNYKGAILELEKYVDLISGVKTQIEQKILDVEELRKEFLKNKWAKAKPKSDSLVKEDEWDAAIAIVEKVNSDINSDKANEWFHKLMTAEIKRIEGLKPKAPSAPTEQETFNKLCETLIDKNSTFFIKEGEFLFLKHSAAKKWMKDVTIVSHDSVFVDFLVDNRMGPSTKGIVLFPTFGLDNNPGIKTELKRQIKVNNSAQLKTLNNYLATIKSSGGEDINLSENLKLFDLKGYKKLKLIK